MASFMERRMMPMFYAEVPDMSQQESSFLTQIDGIGDDEDLPPLARVQKKAQSEKMFERQMVVKKVLELFNTGPMPALADDYEEIMNILAKLADEDETEVRTDLLEQIPHIAFQASKCTKRLPALENIVGDHLLPMVVKNLKTGDKRVRMKAHSTLSELMQHNFVTKEQVKTQVCPAVLALSNFENDVDFITGGISLMCKVAPFLGQEITEKWLLERFSSLCSYHEMFYVRKVCVTHIVHFCAVVGKQAYEQVLLPCYIRLCSDDNWNVRQACAEVIMYVACACPQDARRNSLTPVFAKLLQDQNRFVRISAFEKLGPFISTFADPAITSLMYNHIGELVVKTANDIEFRIKTPSIFDLNYKTNESDDDLDELNDEFDENDVPGEEPKTVSGGNASDNFSNSDQAGFDSVNIASFRIYDNYSDTSQSKSENESSDTLKNNEDEEDIKEIVETVKNVVFSYRNRGQTNAKKNFNAGVSSICDKKNDCDNLDREIYKIQDHLKSIHVTCSNIHYGNGDVNHEINSMSTSGLSTDIIKNDDEVLKSFNSYNYWYVSPELPLDPDIVKAGKYDNEDTDEDRVGSEEDHSYFKPCYVSSETENKEIVEQQDIVPQVLIEHFISMTNPYLARETYEKLSWDCAYFLPAVALTLGSKNWHLLQGTLESLAGDIQYKVRKTVASSLHELALIVGPDIASNNLTPIFAGFIKDLDEVRIAVVEHLAQFLRSINFSKRILYLPKLAFFLQTDSELNWRYREMFAKQLVLTIPLFNSTKAAKYYFPNFAEKILCDKVAAVRQVGLLLLTELIKYISSNQTRTSRYLVLFAERFALSKKWQKRQTYALLCSKLLSSNALSPELFASEMLPHLLDLSWDPVPNIRLVVAKTIANHVITNEYFYNPNNQHYDGLETVLKRLQVDKDRDVRNSAVLLNSSIKNAQH